LQEIFIGQMFKSLKEIRFLTTPNRFYPIEFHTYLPFIHWLPKKIHRKILNLIGQKELALEENLNLLSKKEIKAMLEFCSTNFKFDVQVLEVRLLGVVSNWVLFGGK